MLPTLAFQRGRFKPPGHPTGLRIPATATTLPPNIIVPVADPSMVALGTVPLWPANRGSAVTYAPSLNGLGAVFNNSTSNNTISYTRPTSSARRASLECLFFSGAALATKAICGFNNGIDGNNSGGLLQFYFNSSSQLVFYVYDGAQKSAIDSTTTYATGTLYHAIGVADGTNIVLYLNGKQVATAACGVTNGSYTYFCLGSFWPGPLGAAIASNVTVLYASHAETAWSVDQVLERYLDVFGFLNYPEDEAFEQQRLIGGAFKAQSSSFYSWRDS